MSGCPAACSFDAPRGTRVMPHLGQLPGSPRTTSGCIGQVYSPPCVGAAAGSRDVPHLGQLPADDWQTSGCMGQTCICPGAVADACPEWLAPSFGSAARGTACSAFSSAFNDVVSSRPC